MMILIGMYVISTSQSVGTTYWVPIMMILIGMYVISTSQCVGTTYWVPIMMILIGMYVISTSQCVGTTYWVPIMMIVMGMYVISTSQCVGTTYWVPIMMILTVCGYNLLSAHHDDTHRYVRDKYFFYDFIIFFYFLFSERTLSVHIFFSIRWIIYIFSGPCLLTLKYSILQLSYCCTAIIAVLSTQRHCSQIIRWKDLHDYNHPDFIKLYNEIIFWWRMH